MLSISQLSGTTCEASSEHSDQFKCENALDGKLSGGGYFEWATNEELIGAWIKVSLILEQTLKLCPN